MSAAFDHRALFDRDRAHALGVLAAAGASFAAKLDALSKVEALADANTLRELGAVAEDNDVPVRMAILAVARRLGGYERWMTELQSSDATARAEAARALGVLRVTDAVPALVLRLDDLDDAVREQVASAFIRLPDRRAEASLVRLLSSDPSPDVRGACAQALGELGCADALARAAETEEDPFTVVLIERSLWRLEERRRG